MVIYDRVFSRASGKIKKGDLCYQIRLSCEKEFLSGKPFRFAVFQGRSESPLQLVVCEKFFPTLESAEIEIEQTVAEITGRGFKRSSPRRYPDSLLGI